MAVLVIYKLDSDEDPVSTLQAGEYVFGRGALLKCDDRRVSRKHGVITVTEAAATITSTHQNPCFYQSASSSTITILPKDSPMNISDGDKFALLADQFWFRIKVEKAHDLQVANGSNTASPGVSRASNEAQDINNDSDNSMDFLQTTQKRASEDDAEMPTSKKPKPEEAPVKDEADELLSILADLRNSEAMSESEDEENNVDVKSTAQQGTLKKGPAASKQKEVGDLRKREAMSESEDEDAKPTMIAKKATPKKGRAPPKKKAESAAAAQSAHDAELQSMLLSSDDEAEPTAACNTEQATSETTNKKEELQSDDENKDNKASDSNGTRKDAEKDDGSAQTTNNDPDKAGTSGTKKRQVRDHCWYGLSCYRKNSQHLAEYSHPGDSDYESDPNDDRPMCAFGDSCYRRNKDHRQAYKHKQQPQKPQGKRAKKNNVGAPAKKRTARKRYDESSEDDYDMEDPFMADSGSEYEADSGSDFDDDSDSEEGSGTEEETKRLMKEAKKFTKGKKKDKDSD